MKVIGSYRKRDGTIVRIERKNANNYSVISNNGLNDTILYSDLTYDTLLSHLTIGMGQLESIANSVNGELKQIKNEYDRRDSLVFGDDVISVLDADDEGITPSWIVLSFNNDRRKYVVSDPLYTSNLWFYLTVFFALLSIIMELK
jgi:hypothetical protein